ncbi:MAG: GNAT family N-acetyltransferase [Gemmatimonadaceae bacterium]
MTFAPQTSPAITLRPATVEDVPAILRCIQGLADYEKLAHECQATEGLLVESLFGPTPAAEVTLALAGDVPAGFALWFRSYSTFLALPGIYLEDLFVFPDFRGLGIGKRLLTSLAKTAVDRGYGRLEWAVLDWNVDAIGFYESLGAVPMGDWTTFRLTGDALREVYGFCDEAQ